MASFAREEALVRRLLAPLGWESAATANPNVAGKETGTDVIARPATGRPERPYWFSGCVFVRIFGN
jgi:hypothetical protein